MQRFICFFIPVFAMSLATYVYVYNDVDRYYESAEPVFESVFPWKFGFNSGDMFYMLPLHINKPPSVTDIRVTLVSDLVTVEKSKRTYYNGKNVLMFARQLSDPEAKINVNLYTSNGLCRSIRIAEGKVGSEKSEKEYKYTDICLKDINKPCVLLMDFKDVVCKESSHKNLETTTNETTENDTNVQPTNNTFIIIGSLSGITLILIAIIAIRKRCWFKHSPQGTPDLPTNHHSEPFYLNMLFRKECNQEIAEIEQHHYEEIGPRATEGG